MDTLQIKTLSHEIKEKMILIRREIHKNPELGFKEFKTASLIAGYLSELGFDVKTNIAATGVTALLSGNKPGKTLALRADIDALPITESNDIAYASQIEGIMHACGHDIHISTVLGTATILSKLKDQVHGNIKFIFQPGEEGLGGANRMITEGVLENPQVDAIIATHVNPSLLTGQISIRSGPVMATPSEFEIRITGKGGHAAEPHKSTNPITIGSNIVNLFQSVVTKEQDPLKKAVLTVTYFHAGTTFNIIPDTVVIKGTVRTFSIQLSKEIASKMEQIVHEQTTSLGANYQFTYDIGYPPVVNDTKMVKKFIASAKNILEPMDIITDSEPYMLAEDFAYYAQKVPGAFFHLGCRNPKSEKIYNLHSSDFNPDEDCIQIGMALMTKFALDFLNEK